MTEIWGYLTISGLQLDYFCHHHPFMASRPGRRIIVHTYSQKSKSGITDWDLDHGLLHGYSRYKRSTVHPRICRQVPADCQRQSDDSREYRSSVDEFIALVGTTYHEVTVENSKNWLYPLNKDLFFIELHQNPPLSWCMDDNHKGWHTLPGLLQIQMGLTYAALDSE